MARGSQIFAEGYYAPFHKDFKHRMYSVSKSFVGVAIGLVIEEGLLTLDDKFVQFFPEYVTEDTPEMLKDMTMRDVLTMQTCTADRPETQKLRIKVQIIDKYFANMSMEFGFKDDKVGICMIKNAEEFLKEYQGFTNGKMM